MARGEVSLVTAIICLAGLSPAFLSASLTKDSLVSVSSVVPDLDTSINNEWATSIEASMADASSGSTLLMNLASILNVLFFLAQFSSAMYIARGPKSLPPIPICTTVVNFSPAALVISPLCTLLANSAIRSC